MAGSEIEICNRALDMIGQSPITAFIDPGSKAGACERNYPLSRDAVLRAYPWNSASRRARIAALTTAPEWGFGYQYQLPVGCLRVLGSEGDLDGVVWRREGNLLLCDEAGPLNIRYVARVTDPGEFDPLLADCIAAHLAKSIAFLVTGSSTAVEMANAEYERRVREARMIDAREQSQDEQLGATTWFNARY